MNRVGASGFGISDHHRREVFILLPKLGIPRATLLAMPVICRKRRAVDLGSESTGPIF